MRRLVLSPTARLDYRTLLEESSRQYGQAAAARYRALFGAAFEELRRRPERAQRDDLPLGCLVLPLRMSRLSLPSDQRVKSPPHVVIYRFGADRVEVVRILHERMDIPGVLRNRKRDWSLEP